MADGLPRAAGAVVFAEPAGDQVEILFLRAPALLQDAVKVGAVLGQRRLAGHRLERGTQERQHGGRQVRPQGVEGVLTLTAVGDEAGLPQLGKLRRDARLAHAEDLLQLGHGELLLHHERQQPQAGRVGEDLESVPGGVHAGTRLGGAAGGGNAERRARLSARVNAQRSTLKCRVWRGSDGRLPMPLNGDD